MSAPGIAGQIDPISAIAQALGGNQGSGNAATSAFEAEAQIPDNKVLQRFDILQAAKGGTSQAWAAIGAPDFHLLFEPSAEQPVGMNSSLDPMVLPANRFALIQNMRPDGGTLKVRQSTTLLTTTWSGGNTSAGALSGGSLFRGAWSGPLNGTVWCLAAYANAGIVFVYESSDGLTWTEVTSATGAQWGPGANGTRIAEGSAGRQCAFQAVTDKTSDKDYVVILDGNDFPRVYLSSATAGNKVRIVNQIGAPTWASGQQPNYGSGFSQNVMNFAVTNANLGLSADGSTNLVASGVNNIFGSNFMAVTVKPAVVNGNFCQTLNTQFSFAMPFQSNPTQLAIVADGSDKNFWNNVKVEIADLTGTHYSTVYDPSVSTYPPPTRTVMTGGGLTNAEIIVYSMVGVTDNTSNIENWACLKFTWAQAPPPTAQYVINVYCASLGYGVSTTPSYAVSYYNSNTVSESAAVVMQTPLSVPLLALSSAASVSSVVIPAAANFQPIYYLKWQNASSTDLANGVDTVRFYRRDAGGTEYYLVKSVTEAVFGGGAWTGQGPANFADYGQTTIDIENPAPSAYNQSMPIGWIMAAANGRIAVAGAGHTTFPYCYFSEYDHPFRYSSQDVFTAGAPLARSSTRFTIQGETIQAIVPVAASELASSTIFVFTDQSTYSVAGGTLGSSSDPFNSAALSVPTLMAKVGCSAPFSAKAYKDAIFFLDDTGNIRRFSYGRSRIMALYYGGVYESMIPISRRVVDDRTRNIPSSRTGNVYGLASFDRYYFAYTPNGQTTNTKVLVYDETAGVFVEDTLPNTAEGIIKAPFASGSQTLVFGANLSVYRHEDPSGVAGLAVELTTREMNTNFWANVEYGRIGLLCDVTSGQSATIVKTLKPLGTTETTTVDLHTNATNQVWRYDNDSGNPGGRQGVSCQLDLQATMIPGTKIYALALESRAVQSGADA